MSNYKSKNHILFLLVLVNVGNYLDRQLIFSLFPLLKAEFQTTDFQLGLLGTCFMFTHAIATIPFGIIADKWSKPRLITIGMISWSLFTFLSGLSQRFYQLIVARGFIGIGGATFEPAAVALVTENYEESFRSRALGIMKTGMWFGGMLGLALGGVLGSYLGWRVTLFLAAVPGFILAFFTRKIPVKKINENHKYSIKQVFNLNSSVILIIIGGVFITFSSGAFIAWVITFIVRYGYYELSTGAIIVGAIATVFGLIGVLAGSSIADKYYQVNRGGRLYTVAIGVMASVPFIILALYAPNRELLLVGIALGTFFMAWYHGPIMAAIMDTVKPEMRGTITGLYIFFIHIFGDMPSPVIVGKISDSTNLRIGLLVTVAGNIIGALCLIMAVKKKPDE